MKALINGIGVIGGFGCGTQSLEEAVINHDPPHCGTAAEKLRRG